MLVLSRKTSEAIIVNELVVVRVVRIGPGSVRLGISAPADWHIRREELPAMEKEIEIPFDGTDPDAFSALAGV
ncbi:carbon storage regulator [Schlesneria paludicola]|uniref:carbon storage regulator n=1 Tax=Schlesneria paludicola TaxID=360056 RepID=UPI00029B4C61|nr:carbon storage regulator [Schlesneria paludicola]